MVRVAINGFGRIGRLTLRACLEKEELDIVAINDLTDAPIQAHLFKYDSIHGTYPDHVEAGEGFIEIGNKKIKYTKDKEPKWDNVDLVLECSGHYTSKEKASYHLTVGAKRVLISAPADQVDFTVIKGVNHHQLDSNHRILSNGSCTTNCLAPVVEILNRHIGIEKGYMTTVHAYTGDQRLIDTGHSDFRRARAAALSMIPSSTGAARALGVVFPDLKGKIDGCAIRVPVANVSMIDLTFTAKKNVTVEEINSIMQTEAKDQRWHHVLNYVDLPLVSCDFNHVPYSSNFDTTQTQVVDNNFVRVVSWYDNEWGFSNRMSELAILVGKLN